MSSEEIARQRAVIARFAAIGTEYLDLLEFTEQARTCWPAALDEVERLKAEADEEHAAADYASAEKGRLEVEIDSLADTIEALRAENARLREEIAGWRDDCDGLAYDLRRAMSGGK